MIKKESRIYLAIPYTFDPEQSFKIVNKVAAKLLRDGHIVYSPISHCHPIAQEHDLPKTWEFWAKLDKEFISWCDIVVMINLAENGQELIKNSKGCQAELKFAKELGKEIEYYNL